MRAAGRSNGVLDRALDAAVYLASRRERPFGNGHRPGLIIEAAGANENDERSEQISEADGQVNAESLSHRCPSAV